jgi:peptidoglycan hydrolase-like protein with peptidoglycan-binding domain
MSDTAENNALPPVKLAVAAATTVLCFAIIYNAVAGQEGRQRDVLSRLSDLEQQASLPVTIGVGTFDGRPSTRSMVTLEQLAELAAQEDQREVLVSEVARELAALGVYREPADGRHGAGLGDAIEAYQRDHSLEVTGEPDADLLAHVRFIRKVGQASAAGPVTVDVGKVQEGLARLGYSPGPADGLLGERTRDAIRQFEQDRNLPQTGTITNELAREVSRVLTGG